MIRLAARHVSGLLALLASLSCSGRFIVPEPPSGDPCTDNAECGISRKCDLDQGICVPWDISCSPDEPGGYCRSGLVCACGGICVAPEAGCNTNGETWCDCLETEVCVGGGCEDPAPDGSNLCSEENPGLDCLGPEICVGGECVPDRLDNRCSQTSLHGYCGAGLTCNNGRCEPTADDPCLPDNTTGNCPDGQACSSAGVCDDVECTTNQLGVCPEDQECIRDAGCELLPCSPDHRTGYCSETSQFCCATGQCRDVGDCCAAVDCDQVANTYCATNGECLSYIFISGNCADDEDCRREEMEGSYGRGFECLTNDGDETGTCTERISCTTETDCVVGKFCSRASRCLVEPYCDHDDDCYTTEGEKCSFAVDGTGNRYCIDYACMVAEDCFARCSVTTVTACQVDGDCPMGETCGDGVPALGDTCSLANPNRCIDQGDCADTGDCPCFVNSDCPPGQACDKHCSVTTATSCVLDGACPPGETCGAVSDICIAAGDICTSNGFVRTSQCAPTDDCNPNEIFCCDTCDEDDCCPLGQRCSTAGSCIAPPDCVNDADCLTGYFVCADFTCVAPPGNECNPLTCNVGVCDGCGDCGAGEKCSLVGACIPCGNCIADRPDCPDGEHCNAEYECQPKKECGFDELSAASLVQPNMLVVLDRSGSMNLCQGTAEGTNYCCGGYVSDAGSICTSDDQCDDGNCLAMAGDDQCDFADHASCTCAQLCGPPQCLGCAPLTSCDTTDCDHTSPSVCDAACKTTRWDQAAAAVNQLALDYQGKIAFGLATYPEQCSPVNTSASAPLNCDGVTEDCGGEPGNQFCDLSQNVCRVNPEKPCDYACNMCNPPCNAYCDNDGNGTRDSLEADNNENGTPDWLEGLIAIGNNTPGSVDVNVGTGTRAAIEAALGTGPGTGHIFPGGGTPTGPTLRNLNQDLAGAGLAATDRENVILLVTDGEAGGDVAEIKTCEPPCDDDIINGDETGEDCGGSCPPCDVGLPCLGRDDCRSRICRAGLCRDPSCANTAPDGTETDIDCGGDCGPCAEEQVCNTPADCITGVCSGGVCAAPICGDGVQNGEETGTDCGAGCADCTVGIGCTVDTDCTTEICEAGKCRISDCRNAAQDGTETALNCGGSDCGPCVDGEACSLDSDCTSGDCCDAGEVAASLCTVAGVCFTPSCANGLLDTGEANIDCGGDCAGCGGGKSCDDDDDCLSTCTVCSGGKTDYTCKVDAALDMLWTHNPRIKTYVIGFAFAAVSESLNCAAVHGRTSLSRRIPIRQCDGNGIACIDDVDCSGQGGLEICETVETVEVCPDVTRDNCAPYVCDDNGAVCTSDSDCAGDCILGGLCEANAAPCLDAGNCPGGACIASSACYFQANDQEGLSKAFDEIVTEVASCSYGLSGVPPNVSRLYVYLDRSGVVTRIARDVTHIEGWDYVASTNQVEFFGQTCADVKTGAVTPIVIRGGLPGEEPCP